MAGFTAVNATIVCPECRSDDIDPDATRCPHCRHRFLTRADKRRRVIIACVIGVWAGLFITAKINRDENHRIRHDEKCAQIGNVSPDCP